MLETLSLEAFAHYTRGMVTMFFILWAGEIHRHRHRNSMTEVLFVTVCFIAFGYLKDSIFLFTPWMTDPYIENVVSLTDVVCTPFVIAFFLEATRPGIVTTRRLAAGIALFLLPLTGYLVTGHVMAIQAAYVLSFVASLVSFILIIRYVISYNRCVTENYSYTQNISVKWVAGSATAYFAWFFTYFLCFNKTTWGSEAVFDLFSIAIWLVMWRFSSKHHVIIEMLGKEQPVAEPKAKRRTSSKESFFTQVLARKMDEEKAYLNPRLSLTELALSIGSNKSYLSEFLNSQGTTFYDYINVFRVAEACRLLESVKPGERTSMAAVSKNSGFNSIASFNRYFYKIKGMTPTAYLRSHMLLSEEVQPDKTE